MSYIYHICSLGRILRKPTTLKYSEYTAQCCYLLDQAGYVESDHLLLYYIQLQRIAEEASTTFDYESNSSISPMDARHVGVVARDLERQADLLLLSVPIEMRNNSKTNGLARY